MRAAIGTHKQGGRDYNASNSTSRRLKSGVYQGGQGTLSCQTQAHSDIAVIIYGIWYLMGRSDR
jgi:hypothetical protein